MCFHFCLFCVVPTAAVCRKAGEALVIEEIEVAPPKAWEVRIKVLCTSLCHTDVTFWKLDAVSSPHYAPYRIYYIVGHLLNFEF